MEQQSRFKEWLTGDTPAIGCWLHLFSPIAAEVVAQAGYDCVMIDLEHGPGGLMDAIALMQAVQGRDCAPLLRVAANDPVRIKRALDTGIAGIMVPAVDSKVEAEAVVEACCYPPEGRRGMAPSIVRASDYGANWRGYVERAARDLLIICQIESAAAARAAGEIAAVEGVDMLFLGPFDLSAALGYVGQPDHPEIQACIAEIEQAAKAAGKLLGGIPTPARPAEALFAAGYDLVLADFDLVLLRDGARASVARLRAASEARPTDGAG
jgi:2-keto-3-deoxy-L-rhamnonate aldolase RhmA